MQSAGSYYYGPTANLSDAGLPEAEKLDAARAAGMDTVLCARDVLPPSAAHGAIRSFDALP